MSLKVSDSEFQISSDFKIPPTGYKLQKGDRMRRLGTRFWGDICEHDQGKKASFFNNAEPQEYEAHMLVRNPKQNIWFPEI